MRGMAIALVDFLCNEVNMCTVVTADAMEYSLVYVHTGNQGWMYMNPVVRLVLLSYVLQYCPTFSPLYRVQWVSSAIILSWNSWKEFHGQKS
jgi:hypothetical protein